MKQELKPCPFCGGMAELEETVGGQFAVACAECSCNLSMLYDTSDEAVAAWNERMEISPVG